MPLVKLNVLDGMAKTQLVDPRAPCDIGVHFHNRHSIYEFLCLRLMRLKTDLKSIRVEGLVFEVALGKTLGPESDSVEYSVLE